MKIQTKISGVMGFILVTTNIFVAPHINDAVNWFFERVIITNTGIFSAVAGGWFIGLTIYYYRKANGIKLPKVGKLTTKSGMKYVTTK